MLETNFGPMAQDGDYVLVVDFNYMKRKCDTYVARVYRGKAYTGVRIPGTNKYVHKLRAEAILPENYIPGTGKYIHKLRAECVIPENYVSQEAKRKICEDIAIHNRDTIEYDVKGGILWVR